MNTLYLVCSQSCINQMEIPYLLNNSPDLHGNSSAGENWAGYELDGIEIDHEPGPLGKIRVHDDYWNLDNEDKQWYNFEIRNTMHLTEEQFLGLLNISNKYSIALLLHAQNLEDIWRWSRNHPVLLINPIISEWEENIETWAPREYNYLMEDDRNANYSGYDHHWPGYNAIAQKFVERMKYDNEIAKYYSDRLIRQPQWMRKPDIYTLWDTVGIEPPSKEWIDAYVDDYKSKQELDLEKLALLREAYDAVRK